MPSGTAIGCVEHQCENRMEGFSSLLHLRTCQEKMFMVLASHCDARGKSDEISGFAVAGLLASQYAWEEFVTKYNPLAIEEADLGAFLKTAASAGIVGVGAVAGAATSPSILSASKISLIPAIGVDPRLVCFERCVLGAARSMESAPAGETVCFVMDWREPLASPALWHLEDLLNFSPAPLRERLGALGFEHPETFSPLRAASWLAKRCAEMKPGADFRPASKELPGLHWTFPDGSSSPSPHELPQMSQPAR